MSRTSAVGVLLVNTGSPEAPTPEALRRYLREFLSDARVVDWPRWLWLPILHGIVLRSRPPRSAALYRRIWTAEGSPLIAISDRQRCALADRLGDGYAVAIGMRYGEPSLASAAAALSEAGCDHIVVVPMFPQFAEATVGTILAAAANVLGDDSWSSVSPFFDDNSYIEALAAAIESRRTDEHLVLSFHGLPKRHVRRGDAYADQCRITADLLARRLGLSQDDWSLAFQSRFGPERWLEPATDALVCSLAQRHPKLLIACPGFTADCLETLDEIGNDLANRFAKAGGEELVLVPCLNDAEAFMDFLARLVTQAT